jgi:hypothetical protein
VLLQAHVASTVWPLIRQTVQQFMRLTWSTRHFSRTLPNRHAPVPTKHTKLGAAPVNGVRETQAAGAFRRNGKRPSIATGLAIP